MRRSSPSAFAASRSGRAAFRFDDLVKVREYQAHAEQYNQEVADYLAVMTQAGGPVRFPDRLGYAVLQYHFDGIQPFVEVGLTRYRDTIASGFRLQNELYRQSRIVRPERVWTPLREGMGLVENKLAVFQTGQQAFHPALGVQALVVIVRNGVPGVVLMTRSMHLAARPGWLQFPPSGGMEFFGNDPENISSDLISQSDPGLSLCRELMEELFAAEESETDWELFDSLVVSEFGTRLETAFEDGSADVRFLGVVADAMTGRPELSFLIVAREVDWEIRQSEESRVVPSLESFPNLAALLADPAVHLCPSSAGLLRLAIDSGALVEAEVLSDDVGSALFGKG
jgi:hypothetical protein